MRAQVDAAGLPLVALVCAEAYPDAVGGVKHVQEREA